MKIGKLTQDGYGNYGNILQNYALQEFLLNYADTVDSVWHTPTELLCKFWQWGWKGEIKYLINYKNFRKNVKSGYMSWEYVRNARFYDFSQKYIHNVNPTGKLDNIAEQYDFFIVGSDQVWKPTSKRLDMGFLKFAPPEKRISFAASIGAVTIPETQKEYYKRSFEEMSAISVREDSAAQIIKEMTGRDAAVVLDPCFCLNKNEWESISEVPYWLPDTKYMFTYFLGPTPKEVEQIGKRLGLEVVSAFSRDNFYHATMSPQEWVSIIENAELIYTDSFHCTVFSMIFHKPFVVCDRVGNSRTQEMRTRLHTLLSKFRMEERFATKDTGYEIQGPLEITYGGYDGILERELSHSDNFLRNALNLL